GRGRNHGVLTLRATLRSLGDHGIDFGRGGTGIARRTGGTRRDWCGGGDDVGAINRRGGGRRVGHRPVERFGDAGGRLRIGGGGECLACAQRGDLGGGSLVRRLRYVVPEAAGIDDIGRRLQLRLGGRLRSLFCFRLGFGLGLGR